MSNSKVEKALLKGTMKQRINLLCNHVGDQSLSGKGFLTEDEVSSLVSSFKTDKELEAYRKYKRYFETVRNDLTNLAQGRLSYMVTLDRLEKAILTRIANEDFEDAVNLAIDQITDKKAKKEIAESIQSRFSSIPMNRFIDLDKEGYLRVKHQEHLADEMINGLKKALKNDQIKLKTHLKALNDFLDEIGLKVRVFQGYIKNTENWLKGDKGKEGTWLLSRKAGRESFALEEDINTVEINENLYDYYKRGLYGE